MKRSGLIATILVVQVLSALFFVSDIMIALIGWPVIAVNWQVHELIEIAAAISLVLGVVAGALLLRNAMHRTARAESQLRLASGAFADVVSDHFEEWGLTPAERDVALFVLKGLTTQEIADLRDTSDGTVKAQTNAIYRKSGVSSRSQLMSLFVDDLMGEGFVPGERP